MFEPDVNLCAGRFCCILRRAQTVVSAVGGQYLSLIFRIKPVTLCPFRFVRRLLTKSFSAHFFWLLLCLEKRLAATETSIASILCINPGRTCTSVRRVLSLQNGSCRSLSCLRDVSDRNPANRCLVHGLPVTRKEWTAPAHG